MAPNDQSKIQVNAQKYFFGFYEVDPFPEKDPQISRLLYEANNALLQFHILPRGTIQEAMREGELIAPYNLRGLLHHPKKEDFLPPPCVPCQWSSSCCSHGTSLSDKEHQAIEEKFGSEHTIYDQEEQEYRTAIKDGRCIFSNKDSGCLIHEEPFYPKVCFNFPYTDISGKKPYPYDINICPAFEEKQPWNTLMDRKTKRLRLAL
jgi:hypothetical protein